MSLVAIVLAACAAASSDAPAPVAKTTPAPAASCPTGPIDCQAACDGYAAFIADLQRDPTFNGDPLDRDQCLAQCTAPVNAEQRVEFACYVGAMDAKTAGGCFDRCRP